VGKCRNQNRYYSHPGDTCRPVLVQVGWGCLDRFIKKGHDCYVTTGTEGQVRTDSRLVGESSAVPKPRLATAELHLKSLDRLFETKRSSAVGI
jgi:hypothetical protein